MFLLPAFVNKSGRAVCSPAPARDSSGAVGELFLAHKPLENSRLGQGAIGGRGR